MKTTIQLVLVALAISSCLAIQGTQVGTWSKTYWATGHAFEKGGSQRTESYNIDFATEFDTVPTVVVGLNGFDLSFQNAGVRVFAKSITTTGFTLFVIAPDNCAVYFTGVSWLASTTDGISVSYISKNVNDDKDFKNQRSYYQMQLTHPKTLSAPGAAAAINGFTFGPGGNMRLLVKADNVNAKTVDLTFGSWADTNLIAADIVVISFEASAGRASSMGDISSPVASGPLYTGSGGTWTGNVKVGSATSLTWVAVNHIDSIYGRNYRLTQDWSRSEDTLSVKITTWANTLLYNIIDTVFVANPDYQYPQTQTGRFSKTYWATGDLFEKDASKDRVHFLRVHYTKPFSKKPKVAVALTGFDLAYNNAGVKLEVVKARRRYFVVKITAPKDSLIYFAGIAYIATLSPRIGFSVIDDSPSQDKLNNVRDGDGGKYLTYTQKHPLTLPNPNAASFLSGFKFGAGANIRLRTWVQSVDTKGANVKVGTWADTVLQQFTVLVIHFENVPKQGVAKIVSDGMRGVATQVKSLTVFPQSEIFVALSHIDFLNGNNYRLTQAFNLKGDQLSSTMKTWADTNLYQIQDTVFFAESTRTSPILTQTGLWTKTYYATGHIFEKDASKERSEKITVTFAKEFDYTPQVAIGLLGLDLSFSNAAVRVLATDISTTGFSILIIAPQNALVYFVSISWLATVNDAIQIKTVSMDQSKGDFSIGGGGERTLSKALVASNKYGKPSAAVAISGFRFTNSGNARLRTSISSVDQSGVNYNVGTWADTQWQGVDLTFIVFDASDSRNGVVQIDSTVTGALYGGSGSRSESQTGKGVPTGSVWWAGLNHIDFIFNRNYRVKQAFTLDENGFKVTWSNWADTMIWQIKDTVFYTIPQY